MAASGARREATLREFVTAFASGDMELLARLLAVDFQYHVCAGVPYAREFSGLDGFTRYLLDMAQLDLETTWEALSVVGGEDYGLLVASIQARRGRMHLESKTAMICRFEGDAIAEVWELALDPAERTSFLSNPPRKQR